MKLPLTVDLLQAVYDMLCETPPFNRWNLPNSEDITFKVTRDKKFMGWCLYTGGRYTIGISRANVDRLDVLIQIMMHEMVHVHERNVNVSRTDIMHSEAWKLWADEVCRVHNIDPELFMYGELPDEDDNWKKTRALSS